MLTYACHSTLFIGFTSHEKSLACVLDGCQNGHFTLRPTRGKPHSVLIACCLGNSTGNGSLSLPLWSRSWNTQDQCLRLGLPGNPSITNVATLPLPMSTGSDASEPNGCGLPLPLMILLEVYLRLLVEDVIPDSSPGWQRQNHGARQNVFIVEVYQDLEYSSKPYIGTGYEPVQGSWHQTEWEEYIVDYEKRNTFKTKTGPDIGYGHKWSIFCSSTEVNFSFE